jgi:cell division septation protein DedD
LPLPQFEFGRPDELVVLSKELIGSPRRRRIAIGAVGLVMVAAISFGVVRHQRAAREQSAPPQNASINSMPIAPKQEPAQSASSPAEAAHREPHHKKGVLASHANPAAAAPVPSSAPLPQVSTSTDNTASAGTSRRGKYNIVVNDAMPHDDADEIAKRLRDLGYNAYLLQTDHNSEASWMVKVGPYQTAAEANAAQQELNQKYHDAYPPSSQ